MPSGKKTKTKTDTSQKESILFFVSKLTIPSGAVQTFKEVPDIWREKDHFQ